MQAFTLTSKSGILDRLNTNVKVNSKYRNSTNLYDINTKWTATWDTGATHTCISKSMAEKLNLTPIGEGTSGTAGGLIQVNTYLVDILLPSGLLINDLQVFGVDLSCSGCDVLIGMDVITLGDFSLTNFSKRTKLSFRTPSLNHVDYVKEYNQEVAVASENK